ncbi:autophagy protein 16-domain-containing protein [Dipodascopsis tothii]|uniref:autophagy protein 16-domain-containing protein n=1 Tax=Dipodascopsis tothii TaxID=44089 RepID=UPI0034CFBECA
MWRQSLVDALDERDRRESAFPIVAAFAKLAARAAACEARDAGSPRPDRRPAPGKPGARADASQLRADLDELYEINRETKAAYGRTQTELDAARAALARVQAKYDALKAERVRLAGRLQARDEEMREKNRAVQVAQDEILTYQILLNVAEDKVAKLEAENRQLVERWMERVSREADKLNDANAFLESVDRSRQRSREPDEVAVAVAAAAADTVAAEMAEGLAEGLGQADGGGGSPPAGAGA